MGETNKEPGNQWQPGKQPGSGMQDIQDGALLNTESGNES